MPTVAGLLAAIGAGLVAVNEPSLRLPGIILNVLGTAMLGVVAKQYNVHGGTVPQATPLAVQAETLKEGIVLACKQDVAKCDEVNK
jgi:hypothetical protein